MVELGDIGHDGQRVRVLEVNHILSIQKIRNGHFCGSQLEGFLAVAENNYLLFTGTGCLKRRICVDIFGTPAAAFQILVSYSFKYFSASSHRLE